MNRKQLIIIVVLGLVLGGVGIYLNKKKTESFSNTAKIEREKLLGDFPINDIAQITVSQSTNSAHLFKLDGWSVKERNNYPADVSSIVEFARKLWDLQAAQSQKIGESQLSRMELLPPDKGGTNSGTLVELKSEDGKLIRSLLLGKPSMRGDGGNDAFGGGSWPNGRWIYLPDKPGTAYLVSETFSDVAPKPEHWMSKDFFKVEKPESIAVTFPDSTNSWTLTRETESGQWKLADAKPDEELDSSKVSSMSYAFSSPSFTDVAIDVPAGQEGFDNPDSIVIKTFDGFEYTVKVGSKTNDDYFLNVSVAADLPAQRKPGADEKPEDKEKLDKEFSETQSKFKDKLAQEKKFEKWTYLVPSWSVDSVLKKRSELLAEKKAEAKSEAASDESGTEKADEEVGESTN